MTTTNDAILYGPNPAFTPFDVSTIDIKTVVNVADAVVDEVGTDYRYQHDPTGERCTYVRNSAPSCLVAVILNRIGVPVEQLDHWDGTREQAIRSIPHFREADPNVINFLSAAQLHQDNDGTWADAIAIAKIMFRKHLL